MSRRDIVNEVYRDFVVSGVPSSGPNKANKADIRFLLGDMSDVLDALVAGQAGGWLAFDTFAHLQAVTAAEVNQQACVYSDAPARNGIYRNTGTSTAAIWSRISPLIYGLLPVAEVTPGENTFMRPAAAWSSTVFLWKNFAGVGAYRQNEHWIFVPNDNNRRYAAFGFCDYGTLGVVHFGRQAEAIAARFTHHAAGAGVTKTGSWSNSTSTEAREGSASKSNVAGDTITFTVTGTAVGLAVARITNGGFATVAIDGDYAAADLLPAVGAAEVAAGFFAESDVGKRYIDCYLSGTDWDRHIPLSETLAAGSHTVTVRAQGTKRAASSDTRAYVVGVFAYDFSEVMGVAGAIPFFTFDVTNTPTNTFSSQVSAKTFNPTGYSNPQFIGDNHGSETSTSTTFAVDGVSASLSADAFASGREATLTVVSWLTHPSVTPTKVVDLVTVYSGRADRIAHLSASQAETWQYAGTLAETYYGELTTSFAYMPAVFDRSFVGDTSYPIAVSASNGSSGSLQKTAVGFYSTVHDLVAMAYIPNPETTLNNWAHSAPNYAFVQHLKDNQEKAYFTRSTTSNTDTVTVGTSRSATIGWRIRRVAGLTKI